MAKIKIKPVGEYIQIEPIYADHVGSIVLANNVSEGEKEYAETGIVLSVGNSVQDIKAGDTIILDQFAIEPVWLQGETIYLHKASRVKGIVLDNAN